MGVTAEALKEFAGGKLLIISEFSGEYIVGNIYLDEEKDICIITINKTIATLTLPHPKHWKFDTFIANCIRTENHILYKNPA